MALLIVKVIMFLGEAHLLTERGTMYHGGVDLSMVEEAIDNGVMSLLTEQAIMSVFRKYYDEEMNYKGE